VCQDKALESDAMIKRKWVVLLKSKLYELQQLRVKMMQRMKRQATV
jgi:hypothetical protein